VLVHLCPCVCLFFFFFTFSLVFVVWLAEHAQTSHDSARPANNQMDKFPPDRISIPDKHFTCIMAKPDGTPCGKRFSHKHDLKTHQRTHTGERPYQCSHCPQTFTRSSDMRSHERTHTGVKPFSCAVAGCDKTFSRGNDARRHSQLHGAIANGAHPVATASPVGLSALGSVNVFSPTAAVAAVEAVSTVTPNASAIDGLGAFPLPWDSSLLVLSVPSVNSATLPVASKKRAASESIDADAMFANAKRGKTPTIF
jgi:hypothetical protein